jgi:hypothetical protein
VQIDVFVTDADGRPVLPIVPIRQWVLTLPHRLRYDLAWDHVRCRAVMRAAHVVQVREVGTRQMGEPQSEVTRETDAVRLAAAMGVKSSVDWLAPRAALRIRRLSPSRHLLRSAASAVPVQAPA